MYEYQVISEWGTRDDIIDERLERSLNNSAKNGWRCVSIAQSHDKGVQEIRVIMERERVDG